MYHRLRNRFGHGRWNSYVTWVMSNIVSIHLETVLVSPQDRCVVCAKHTKAQKSFWMHQMVLLGDEAQVEACFGPFGDIVILMQDSCMVCTEHSIGSDIILDARNGTLW